MHHLIRYLPDPKSTVLIVGYQAQGTIGRKLYDGTHEAHIYKEVVPVRAQIKAIGAFSAHADQGKLLAWVKRAMPKKIALIHGEDKSREALHRKLERDLHIPTIMPKKGESVEV